MYSKKKRANDVKAVLCLFAVVALVVLAFWALAAVAHAAAPACGSRCVVNTTCPADCTARPVMIENTTCQPAVCAVKLRDRCVLPWNCPNGECQPSDVNVQVSVPDSAPPFLPPASVDPPADHRFPWGLLLAAVIGSAALAGGIAFALRVSAAESSQP